MNVHLYAFVCMCLCIYVGFIYLCIYLDTAYKRACMSIHVLIMLYFIYTKKKNVGGGKLLKALGNTCKTNFADKMKTSQFVNFLTK